MCAVFYGTTQKGEDVQQFVLRNAAGVEIRCINYGCRFTDMLLPTREGGTANILLGYNSLAAYETDAGGQGAFIGRYANRIENAAFSLEGRQFALRKNEGNNFLHGCFAHRVFNARQAGENSVSFAYVSPAGEDGFPGELTVSVLYTLTDDNELILDYRAVTDTATHLNLTNHSYFDLSGSGEGLAGQSLWLAAAQFLEARSDLCPTGRILDTKGGAFDFTEEKSLTKDIDADDPQLAIGGGYDHCFLLDKLRPGQFSVAAIARHPKSGRTLRVYTTQPALQLYTGNFLGNADAPAGRDGRPFAHREGFCLETQHYPCSPSHPEFPSTLLLPGEKYHEITLLQFGF